MSNDEAARTRALAKGDQTAARLRGYMGRGAFRLDRGQLEALTNRGASQDEIQAWFEEQGRRAVAEQAILDELEPELKSLTMPFGWRKRIGLGRFISLNLSRRGGSLTGRLGPASSNSRTRRLRIRLPSGRWWQSRKTRRPPSIRPPRQRQSLGNTCQRVASGGGPTLLGVACGLPDCC